MKYQTITNKVQTVLLDILIAIALSVLFGWLLINFVSGCGDTYHTSDGRLIAGDCIAMPWVEYQGGEEVNAKD